MSIDVSIPFWNQKELNLPEIISVKLICSNPVKISSKLASLTLEITSCLEENSSALRTQSILLKKLLRRMKNVFRNAKAFKILQMASKTLSNFDGSEYSRVLASVRTCTYDNKGPSKQMIQWALINLMRLAALFNRLHNLSINAVFCLKDKFSSGHHWNIAAVSVAVMSKIWSISKRLISNSCTWYANLFEFLPLVATVGNEWLPDGFEIQENLFDWLGLSCSIKKPILTSAIDRSDTKLEAISAQQTSLNFNEDIGESLQGKYHEFKTVKELLSFLKSEKESRQKDLNNAMSVRLNKKQWNKLCIKIMEAVKILKCGDTTPDERQVILLSASQNIYNAFR